MARRKMAKRNHEWGTRVDEFENEFYVVHVAFQEIHDGEPRLETISHNVYRVLATDEDAATNIAMAQFARDWPYNLSTPYSLVSEAPERYDLQASA